MNNHSPQIIDLSHPLSVDTPPFPGDPPLTIDVLDSTDRSQEDGQRHLNCSRFAMCIHCGTHVDAPFHFFGDGQTMDCVRLDVFVGRALLIDLPYRQIGGCIDVEQLRPFRTQLQETQRVVLRTGWDETWPRPEYFQSHPVITGAAAKWLVECGTVLIGVDFPSVDRPPFPAHLELLGNGVVILENLTNLGAITTPTFQLSAIPLKLVGRDGSPVRAVAML